MKKISVKILALVLCLATLVSVGLAFSSCQKQEPEIKKMLIENGMSEYVMIRPEKPSDDILKNILDFHKIITSKTGYTIDINTDWVKKPEDIDPNAKEILVGNTNRPETKEVINSLEPNSWAVVDKGNKIVICSNNDALLSVALEWFAENCINSEDKTMAITQDLSKIEGYGNNVMLSINGVSGYQAVYPKGNTKLEYYATLFERKVGVADVVSDEKEAIDCEIVIGDTSRAKSPVFKSNNEYSISVEGTKIFINAANDDILYYAVNDFLENGVTYGETIVSTSPKCNKTDKLTNYYAEGWDLNLPYVKEGKVAPVYNIGPGLDDDLVRESPSDSYMHIVSEVEYSAFENYAKRLESFGFRKVYSSKTDKNDLWGYKFGEAYAYIHYTPSQKYMRVIWDKSSNCEVSEVDCPEKQTGRTTFYQYSIDYTGPKWNTENVGTNCGMLYFIKLQDNSLIMIDGGSASQVDGASMLALYDYLYTITQTPKREPLKIRLWYFTHPDGDHNAVFTKFMEYANGKGNLPDLEAVAFNYPSERANEKVKKDTASYTMINYVNNHYPDIKYLKLHTGMIFNISEVKFEVLGTIENIVDLNGTISDNWDTNDTCTLLRFWVGENSIMMQGDVGNDRSVQDYHIALYTPAYLKSEVLQLSHHGYNDLVKLNEYCAPKYILISNAYENVNSYKRSYFNKLVGSDNVHYAGEYSTAVTLFKGSIAIRSVARYNS